MGAPRVTISSRRRLRGLRAADVRRDADKLLEILDVDAELSVALVDDTEIRRLNSTYLQVDKPTDVLAFAMREGEAGSDADATASRNPPSGRRSSLFASWRATTSA